MFFSDERLMLETLEFTFYIGSTRKFLYFDLFVNTAYIVRRTLHLLYYCIIVLLYSFICLFSILLFLLLKRLGILSYPISLRRKLGFNSKLNFLFTIFLQLIRYSLCF